MCGAVPLHVCVCVCFDDVIFNLKVCHLRCVRSIIQSRSVYISLYTYSHKHNNITLKIRLHVLALSPVYRPSSGCPRKLLSDYTIRVVILEGG